MTRIEFSYAEEEVLIASLSKKGKRYVATYYNQVQGFGATQEEAVQNLVIAFKRWVLKARGLQAIHINPGKCLEKQIKK